MSLAFWGGGKIRRLHQRREKWIAQLFGKMAEDEERGGVGEDEAAR